MRRRPARGCRKPGRPEGHGSATGGTRVAFGEYGIQGLEPAYVTKRQIESARIAINPRIRRGGKGWDKIYPDRPLPQKAGGARDGPRKGHPEGGVANAKPGRGH